MTVQAGIGRFTITVFRAFQDLEVFLVEADNVEFHPKLRNELMEVGNELFFFGGCEKRLEEINRLDPPTPASWVSLIASKPSSPPKKGRVLSTGIASFRLFLSEYKLFRAYPLFPAGPGGWIHSLYKLITI